ncbi:MAG: hypothetical protein ACO1N1_09265 [Dyadobacter fermentans]
MKTLYLLIVIGCLISKDVLAQKPSQKKADVQKKAIRNNPKNVATVKSQTPPRSYSKQTITKTTTTTVTTTIESRLDTINPNLPIPQNELKAHEGKSESSKERLEPLLTGSRITENPTKTDSILGAEVLSQQVNDEKKETTGKATDHAGSKSSSNHTVRADSAKTGKDPNGPDLTNTVPIDSSDNQNGDPDTNHIVPDQSDTVNGSQLGGLINYNFSGNNKGFANLTPVVDFGWSRTLLKSGKPFNIDFNVNPYAAGQISMKDSLSYIPGLMLPGKAGIKINFIFRITSGEFTFFGSPGNFGFKLISDFADSTKVLAQHNFRQSIGVAYSDAFIFGAQITRGWHNATSESQNLFESIFSKKATDIKYLTLTLQTKLSEKFSETPAYLYAEWRSLLQKDSYAAFSNNRIITIGIRADMSFERTAPAANGSPRFSGKKARDRNPGTKSRPLAITKFFR